MSEEKEKKEEVETFEDFIKKARMALLKSLIKREEGKKLSLEDVIILKLLAPEVFSPPATKVPQTPIVIQERNPLSELLYISFAREFLENLRKRPTGETKPTTTTRTASERGLPDIDKLLDHFYKVSLIRTLTANPMGVMVTRDKDGNLVVHNPLVEQTERVNKLYDTIVDKLLERLSEVSKMNPIEMTKGVIDALKEAGFVVPASEKSTVPEIEKMRLDLEKWKAEKDLEFRKWQVEKMHEVERERLERQERLEELKNLRTQIQQIGGVAREAITKIGTQLASAFVSGHLSSRLGATQQSSSPSSTTTPQSSPPQSPPQYSPEEAKKILQQRLAQIKEARKALDKTEESLKRQLAILEGKVPAEEGEKERVLKAIDIIA